MALRNSTPASASNPGFEAEEGDTTTVAESAAPAAAPAPQPDAKTTAVAVSSTNALVNALRKGTVLDEFQGVIEVETLETMGIGTFPRVTVDQSGFSKDKTKELGKAIKIELLSWNYVTLITTGEKDNKEADKLIRSSYDHVNVSGEGMTVDAYMAALREQGYDKTSSKKYVEIYANLLWTSEGGAIAPDEVGMVQLSVSPQSVKQWQRFLLESKMRAAKGLVVSTEFTIGSQKVVNGSNTYGVMQFGVATPAK